ncbi:hypothetical protein P171DRAFT_515235 [Karstenula rhodostoma CBS 690.94]|uniref:Rhodopsin domain-containing protein n=1 Tax=Karstenula rhodostoma CBS 690.94 TaxID=1392251 RepID=A0A9P4UIG0_9PLEO|nr:hypothetical protein P171DRAFT_515235 [Karstenula rhodostoma CBS 690.94]
MAPIPRYNHTGIALVAIGASGGLLAMLAVALRLWARRIQKMSLDASDYTCIAALFVALILLGSTVNTVVQGLGLPIQDVTPKQISELAKGMLVGIYTWTTSNTLVRVSMILLYLRVFPSRRFKILCYAFLGINVAYLFANWIGAALICRPFAYNWDQSIAGGHCGDRQRFYIWTGLQNLVQDVVLIAMPMPLLWNLRLPLSKKISLTFVFAMGSGICVITLIRVIDTTKADLQDVTHDYASVGILSVLEPLLGIVNCSLPLLRPIIPRVAELVGPRKTLSNQSKGSYTYGLSIGSRRTRARTLDVYPLDTVATLYENLETQGDGAKPVSDSDSLKELVTGEGVPKRIVVRTDWDVDYDTAR